MIIEAAAQGPLHGLAWEALSGIVLSIGGWIMAFPVRTLYNKVKDTVEDQAKALKEIKTELIEQRTNCLTTLSNQGTEQIKLLGKAVETLEAMHLDQRLLMGKLEK